MQTEVYLHPAEAELIAYDPFGLHSEGHHTIVAGTMRELLDAWGLVYQAYVEAGLIDPHPYRIHTTPQAVAANTAVVLSRMGRVTAATITAHADCGDGLPLDSVCGQELENLRSLGRKLVEVGLFADLRRSQGSGGLEDQLDLMRHAFWYAMHLRADDVVIGVHPRHARYYQKLMSFLPIGPVRAYPTVRNRPVLPMRLDLRCRPFASRLPRGLRHFMDHPVPPHVYAHRIRLERRTIRGTPVDGFLRHLDRCKLTMDGASRPCETLRQAS